MRLDQLDREIVIAADQASQLRGEETRRPLSGGHAHDASRVIREGHPSPVDGGGGLRHTLGHRKHKST